MADSLISPENHTALWAFIAGGTAIAIWLEQSYRWAARLSGPVLALLIAMVLSNTRVMPGASAAYDFVGDWLVPLAIPLLLFRANLREIILTGGRVFAVFHLSAIGTVIGTALAVWMLRSRIGSPETEQAAGMMAGSYIGGGVNFMAIKTSFDVPESIANPLIVADNFVMAGMFVVMLAAAASRWFREHYPHPHCVDASTDKESNPAAEHWSPKNISLLDVAKSFAFGFGVLAIAEAGAGIMHTIFGDSEDASVPIRLLGILLTNKFVVITAVSLVLATVLAKPFSTINGPEELGAYLLMIFLFTLGLPADLLSVLTQAPLFFVFCAIIAGTNLLFTLAAGKILKLNLEEMIVAVNANLGGAPSAAAVAVSAGWPRLVLPGLLAGIWGYVIGTPIGILVMELLQK
jgi:uncharacterized membrane protein